MNLSARTGVDFLVTECKPRAYCSLAFLRKENPEAAPGFKCVKHTAHEPTDSQVQLSFHLAD
jgi:hypothetical protein